MVTNTSSIDSATPALALTSTTVQTQGYGVPGYSNQATSSNLPLRDCIADPVCSRTLGSPFPYYKDESVIDSNDSRMQQVYLANGKLWSGLDTGLGWPSMDMLASWATT